MLFPNVNDVISRVQGLYQQIMMYKRIRRLMTDLTCTEYLITMYDKVIVLELQYMIEEIFVI